jgi:hypothetical protein
MSHILIVGGTGMLNGVPHYYTQHGFTVSVIARNQSGLNKLIESKGEQGFINPIKVDYANYELLKEKINSAIDNYGSIETCICWIHSIAPEAPFIIADVLNNQNVITKYYHVLGSENIQPDGQNKKFELSISKYENLIYKKIILGFVIEDKHSRWLTDLEISNGVIDAVTYEKDVFIVGMVEPWERRP